MPNINYQAGRRWEYQCKRDLERDGYIVVRAAGSKGPVDLIGLHKDTGHVTIISCKRVKDKATGARLIKQFIKEPPFPKLLDKCKQVMKVYVSQGRIYMEGTPS